MVHLLLVLIYLSFISLGLPDALLGAAWPSAYPEFGVPVSYAGILSVIICAGTVVSSLLSDRLTHRFGTAKITAISVATTAAALIGFSFSRSFGLLCVWALPYGLGAGSVDAALNNYVALHFKSRHMSWLHCMWGVGAMTGPYIMGAVLTAGKHWTAGYRVIGILQIVLSGILVLSLPVWKKAVKETDTGASEEEGGRLSLPQTLRIPGVKEVLLCFFCYCAVEQTAALWASSYLTLCKGVSAAAAASYAGMFYIGIAVGRGISGFVTMRFNDKQMVRIGIGIITIGVALFFLPFGKTVSLAGFLTVGFGCAPIFPCIIHATPFRFGASRSQAVIGLQMATSYLGVLVMPPLFGVLAQQFGVSLLPYYLAAVLVLMFWMHERMLRKTVSHTENAPESPLP